MDDDSRLIENILFIIRFSNPTKRAARECYLDIEKSYINIRDKLL